MNPVVIEALVVGGVLGCVLALSTTIYKTEDKASRAAFLGFVLGILVHVSFEISKVNTWYCRHGVACKK
jgi:uncharacterized MnhB-related membrane protein